MGIPDNLTPASCDSSSVPGFQRRQFNGLSYRYGILLEIEWQDLAEKPFGEEDLSFPVFFVAIRDWSLPSSLTA